MDDKAFELIEKLYSEFSSFKEQINQKIDGLDKKVEGIDKKADKNTMLLERMNDKMQILAEVQQNHLEINERQHEDMNNTNKEQMQLLKNALQHVVHNMD
jgi:hypothetical protein